MAQRANQSSAKKAGYSSPAHLHRYRQRNHTVNYKSLFQTLSVRWTVFWLCQALVFVSSWCKGMAVWPYSLRGTVENTIPCISLGVSSCCLPNRRHQGWSLMREWIISLGEITGWQCWAGEMEGEAMRGGLNCGFRYTRGACVCYRLYYQFKHSQKEDMKAKMKQIKYYF